MEEYIKKYPAYDIIHNRVKLPECEECSRATRRSVTHYEKRKIHRDYWNPIARQARGDVVFGLTNDYIIETNGFDKIILEATSSHKKQYSHSYFQVLIDDDEDSLLPQHAKPFPFCSLIILTKEAVRVLNGVAPDEIDFGSGDQYVENIFSNTLFSSQIDLRDQIKCEHVSHYTGKLDGPDEVDNTRPVDNTNWETVGAKQYDLALDYAIIKQMKWVKNKLQEKKSFVENATSAEIGKLTERLIEVSASNTDRGSWWGIHKGTGA